MDLIQIGITSSSILATLGVIAKWIVNSYFKQAKELEEERKRNSSKELEHIKDQWLASKSDMKSFDNRLNEFSLTLTKHTIKMENVEKAIDHTNKEFQRVAIQLEDRYKALEGAELIKVSDNTFILKARK